MTWKPRINRSYARLLVLTSFKHSNFKFEYYVDPGCFSTTAWSFGSQHYFKLQRLSSEQAMSQSLPVATYLYRINQTQHFPCCAHSSQDGSQKESLLHFFSICLKFHHTKTAEHNQVCTVLTTSMQKRIAAHWSLFHKTPLRRALLVLELAPKHVVLKSSTSLTQTLKQQKWV